MSKLNARVVFGRLDVLVNNAGTAIPKSFEETTLEGRLGGAAEGRHSARPLWACR